MERERRFWWERPFTRGSRNGLSWSTAAARTRIAVAQRRKRRIYCMPNVKMQISNSGEPASMGFCCRPIFTLLITRREDSRIGADRGPLKLNNVTRSQWLSRQKTGPRFDAYLQLQVAKLQPMRLPGKINVHKPSPQVSARCDPCVSTLTEDLNLRFGKLELVG